MLRRTLPGFFALLLLCVPVLAMPARATAATPTPQARAEIDHLFAYLRASGCDFNRNGSWHGAAEAAQHLDKKYQYLLKKGMVESAEDFIARAATESSMSGDAYQVRCGTSAPVASATWFGAELRRFRQSHH